MQYKIITPPTTEPLTLGEAKQYLRLTDSTIYEDTAEDATIAGLIIAAREYCENYTGRALMSQTIEAYLDRFPCGDIELPRPPLVSVTSVKYKDYTGAETTLTAETDYIVDVDSPVGQIVLPYGKTWPVAALYTVNPIKIRYIAGYSLPPKTMKLAMLLLTGHWYLNREAVGTATQEIALATHNLLSQSRVRWF